MGGTVLIGGTPSPELLGSTVSVWTVCSATGSSSAVQEDKKESKSRDTSIKSTFFMIVNIKIRQRIAL